MYFSREISEILAGGQKVGSSLVVNGILETKTNTKELDKFGNITTLGRSEGITEELAELFTVLFLSIL